MKITLSLKISSQEANVSEPVLDDISHIQDTRYKMQEFYSPILGPARAYKDDIHERREIQTRDEKKWKRVLAIIMYDIYFVVPEI